MSREPEASQLRLDGVLLADLIEARFANGASDLQAHWSADGELAASTIWRWQNGTLPRTGEDLMKLASLLDVDVFSLLYVDGDRVSEAIDRLIEHSLGGRWGRFAFLSSFFGRQRIWPPVEMAKAQGCLWTIRDFAHDLGNGINRYAAIELASDLNRRVDLFPQVFHFAFRSPGAFASRWLSYGFVVRYRNSVRLFSIKGQVLNCATDITQRAIRVETFFGPSPCDFRVASLHPFELHPDVSSAGTNIPIVRFTG